MNDNIRERILRKLDTLSDERGYQVLDYVEFLVPGFVVTGVLGPHSNAHGPNEFLHLPTGRRITQVIAQVLADHNARKTP